MGTAMPLHEIAGAIVEAEAAIATHRQGARSFRVSAPRAGGSQRALHFAAVWSAQYASARSFGSSESNFWLLLLTSDGTLEWQQTYGTPFFDLEPAATTSST